MPENLTPEVEKEESNDLTWWQWTIIAFVIGLIFCACISSLFSDWSQSVRLDNIESYSIETRKRVDDLGSKSYDYVTDTELDVVKKYIDDRNSGLWDEMRDNWSEIRELDEKLGDRIKDWTKK